MMKRKILLIIAVFIIWSAAFTQGLQSFSGDPLKFTGELTAYYGNISNGKLQDKISLTLDSLILFWDQSSFTEKEKVMIMGNSDMLLKRRINAYPDYYYFMVSILKLKTGRDKEATLNWQYYLRDILVNSSLRQIQDLLEHYYLFLADQILLKSGSIAWRVTNSNFLFEYDTVPRFIFKTTDLLCTSNNDTTVILGSAGVYYPANFCWKGKKGRINWKRVGLDEEIVYADLREYAIDLKSSGYKADSVKFYNKKYFKEPLFGSVEEKVLSSPPGEYSTFPKFVSYLKNYEIKNLFKNIDYFGGLTMRGARLIGSGELNENATITVSRNRKPVVIMRSNAFVILGDQVYANPASVVIRADHDSIYHPGLQVKYFDKTRQLVFIRSQEGLSQSPFFNTFHDIDMDCSAMSWNLEKDSINFESVRGVNRLSVVDFTSSNYYSLYDFMLLQGIDESNPLFVIRKYQKTFGTEEIYPEALAQYMKKSPEQVKAMLYKLSIKGFLFYDQVNDKAIIQDRLYHYIDASAGKTDYDVIRIHSETFDQSNATLNLKNYDLLIRGVSQVFLSDSQNVYIFPDKKEILLKKDRDFVFTGRVRAGLFDFYANACSFEYDSFRLNLPSVDSLNFRVKSFKKDEQGKYPLERVRTVIENLSGRILIDYPSNKSGMKSYPEYPIFISENESYVYYDKDSAYNRDSFKYHVAPFQVENLDNFLTDSLKFDGYLSSAGIFPEISQPLKVQPDYSLGFLNNTSEEGYPIYGGKGRYYSEIDLSNQGLKAKGTLKYLTATVISDDFRFYPDSMTALPVKTLNIEPQEGSVEYPAVMVYNLRQAWYPYHDSMLFYSESKPFMMYDNKALLSGGISYSPKGLSGEGKINYGNVEITSGLFKFGHHTIDADTMDFRLLAEKSRDPAVLADNYRTHFDFTTRKVEFRTNRKGSAVEFPYNNYIGYMDRIDWYMDRNEMILSNQLGGQISSYEQLTNEQLIDLRLTGSDFISTAPGMDSLKFFSATARYDLIKYIIDAKDVRLIRVADAAIFPDSAQLRITRGGKIETLYHAQIIADTTSRYHHITDAQVDILSRNNYRAKGIYPFLGIDKILRKIPLQLVAVDSLGRTFANGFLIKDDNFSLSPWFLYTGKVFMAASQKMLDFDGGFKIVQNCYKPQQEYWTYFHSPLDPENIRIPIGDNPVSLDGKELATAVYISDYEDQVYPSLFGSKRFSDDTTMIKGSGYISFDTLTRTFRIFDGEVFDRATTSEYFLISEKICTIDASGPVDLGLEFGYVSLKSFGDVRYMMVPDSTELDIILTLDFLFDESSLSAISDSMIAADLIGVDISHPDYRRFLTLMLGEEEASNLMDDISMFGTIKRLPDELVHTISFADLRMTWNRVTGSYISKGPIGILGLGKNPVNRYVKGNVEFIRRRSGDVISIYFEVSKKKWYFFDYRSGVLQTLSSDMEYNNRIAELKPERRTMKKSDQEEPYEFVVASRSKLIEFLRRMEEVSK